MFSQASNEWEENFQDLSGWCLPTTNMIKQQCIADPAELNTPVLELGCEELQLNINVSKAETVQDTEEMISIWPSLSEPSFMNVLLPKSDSPLIDVESVDSLVCEDSENNDKCEENSTLLVEPNGLVSLANWECNSPSNTETNTNISVNSKPTEVSTPKPKLKLNIPGSSQYNHTELSTPNIINMLVDSPVMNATKPSSTSVLSLELNPLDGQDDLLQPLVELGGGFDLLAYMFEDMPKAGLEVENEETGDNGTIATEEFTNTNEVHVKPTFTQKPCGKPKSFVWKMEQEGEPSCSPLCVQIKKEESSDEDETHLSKKQLKQRKSRKKSSPKTPETPSKRSRRSTSSNSTLSDSPLDVKYRELRDRNNEASKRSRYNRKVRDGEMSREALRLEKENRSLRIKAEEMERLVKQLRESLLKTIANRN